MAWRNVWRSRRRSGLTMAAIALGLAVLIFISSLTFGMTDMIEDQVARSSLGHVQIHDSVYAASGASCMAMKDASKILRDVESVPGVAAAAPRMILSGNISSRGFGSAHVVRIMGVDPERESKLSILDDRLVDGVFVGSSNTRNESGRESPPGILIGSKLASFLKVGLGSVVRLDSASYESGSSSTDFAVAGIMKTSVDVFDRQTVWVSIDDMRRITGVGDAAHEIVVVGTDGRRVDNLMDRIETALDERADLVVRTWFQARPELEVMINSASGMMLGLYVMMVILLSGGILTSVYMSLHERRQEFGIRLAIGAGPKELLAGIMAESAIVSAIATVAGLAVGAASVFWLATYGLDFGFMSDGFEYAGVLVGTLYRGRVSWRVFVEPSLVVFASSFVFGLWPAVGLARMTPVESIRHGAECGTCRK